MSVELEEGGEEQQECMLKNGMFLVSGYEKLSFCSEPLNLMPIRTVKNHH